MAPLAKQYDLNEYFQHSKTFEYLDMGANPQSSIGTAFAFSRPSREALLLSNTSLLLEYTSRVFLDSLQE